MRMKEHYYHYFINMATKRTQCTGCKSYKIKELNPGVKQTSKEILCTITCECQECGLRFNIKSGTDSGRRRGVRY